MKKAFQVFALLAGIVVLASCRSAPDVIVVDSTGSPVVGATVEPVSLSINYQIVLTDSKGEARIGSKAQDVQWINIKKPGYAPQISVDYTKTKPTRVVLVP